MKLPPTAPTWRWRRRSARKRWLAFFPRRSRKRSRPTLKLTEVTQKAIMPEALAGEEEEGGGERGGGRSGGRRKAA